MFKTSMSVLGCAMANFFTFSRSDVSISFFDAAYTSQPALRSDSAMANPIPLDPPKTIACIAVL